MIQNQASLVLTSMEDALVDDNTKERLSDIPDVIHSIMKDILNSEEAIQQKACDILKEAIEKGYYKKDNQEKEDYKLIDLAFMFYYLGYDISFIKNKEDISGMSVLTACLEENKQIDFDLENFSMLAKLLNSYRYKMTTEEDSTSPNFMYLNGTSSSKKRPKYPTFMYIKMKAVYQSFMESEKGQQILKEYIQQKESSMNPERIVMSFIAIRNSIRLASTMARPDKDKSVDTLIELLKKNVNTYDDLVVYFDFICDHTDVVMSVDHPVINEFKVKYGFMMPIFKEYYDSIDKKAYEESVSHYTDDAYREAFTASILMNGDKVFETKEEYVKKVLNNQFKEFKNV